MCFYFLTMRPTGEIAALVCCGKLSIPSCSYFTIGTVHSDLIPNKKSCYCPTEEPCTVVLTDCVTSLVSEVKASFSFCLCLVGKDLFFLLFLPFTANSRAFPTNQNGRPFQPSAAKFRHSCPTSH
jgi:hypothetical protein